VDFRGFEEGFEEGFQGITGDFKRIRKDR